MTMSNSSLGNIMTRLQGLKNVHGNKKIMPENDLFSNDEVPDVSQTANQLPDFSNFLPSPIENQPQADLGGEITPQSYDIRANTVSSPPPPEEPGFWSKIGSAIGNFIKEAPKARMGGNIPSGSDQFNPEKLIEPTQNMTGNLKTLEDVTFQPYHGMTPSTALSGAGNWLKENFTPSVSPETYNQIPGLQKPPAMLEAEAQKKQLDQQEIEAAKLRPWQVAAYGATDAFANNPELVSEFQTYTGIDFTEQEKEMTEKYEKVLADIEKGYMDVDASYDEQEARIKQSILNNQSTDTDKYYIGLALLMPLLVGGLFGKEAGLGALGGTAKGFADILGQREKNIRSDEEALGDIYKQRSANQMKRGELEMEKMKIPQEIKKNLPKEEYKDLKGSDIYTFRDPKTGEIVTQGAEVLPDLFMDLKYGNTEESRKDMRKEARELEKEKASLERANVATSNIIKAAMQLEDPGIFGKLLSYGLSEETDNALKKAMRQNAPEITIDGRKQNAAVYLDAQIELLKDAYRRNEQMKAFTQTVAGHIGKMAENPFISGLKPQDLIDQTLGLRDRAQNFFVDRASGQGFLKEPLEAKFGKINKELYGSLNKKEERKELARDKQLMYESE